MLLESEILAAQSMSKTEQEVARKLGVSHVTYKKYAKMYGVYGRVMNQPGKGINKIIRNPEAGKHPISKILSGEIANYPSYRLRTRMIQCGLMEEKCCRCGFCEKRIADGRVPVLLAHKDVNIHNKKMENLELLCYNCFFLTVNNPKGMRKAFNLEDGGEKKKKISREVVNTPPLDIPDDVKLSDEELKQLQEGVANGQ